MSHTHTPPETDREHPWHQLHALVQTGIVNRVESFLDSLPPWEQARAVSRLNDVDRTRLMVMLPAQRAADLVEIVNTTQAVELLEGLEPQQAAVIVDGMRSDHQADLVREMEPEQAERILELMVPEQAEEARRLARFSPDTAGGVMVTEYLAFPRHLSSRDVLQALRQYAKQDQKYQVQYAYITDSRGRLIGVLRLRDLLFAEEDVKLADVMVPGPVMLKATATLDEVRQAFESNRFLGIPVVDGQDRLLGVVTRDAMEEAVNARANQTLLKISGIIGGEEFRTMPLHTRSGRRLMWLTLNLFLNIFSAAVVAMFQETLEAAIALAIFLPMVSAMGVNSGGQAAGVSMRELSLGLVQPNELLRVMLKEIGVGLVTGVALAVMIALLALAWKGNPWLGVVVGGGLFFNTIVAVVAGGALPLMVKKWRMDPALVTGPLLTTITDVSGFLLVLGFARMLIERVKG